MTEPVGDPVPTEPVLEVGMLVRVVATGQLHRVLQVSMTGRGATLIETVGPAPLGDDSRAISTSPGGRFVAAAELAIVPIESGSTDWL